MNLFDDLRNRFNEIHTDLTRAVDGLPPKALEHSALQLGHIQLTRQLWAQKEIG